MRIKATDMVLMKDRATANESFVLLPSPSLVEQHFEWDQSSKFRDTGVWITSLKASRMNLQV